MELLLLWLIGAFIVSYIGTNRKIGSLISFLLAFFLSPLIGLIITLCSESKSKAKDRKKLIELQEQNNQLLQKLNKH